MRGAFSTTGGVILLETGRIDQAIDLFTQAIACNLRLAFAYYNRGNAYQLRNEPKTRH
jgi:tetratricopeptide (TPR) repeat protein